MKYTVIVENIKVPIVHDDAQIIDGAISVLKKAGLSNSVKDLYVRKKSIDARKKDNIILVCSVAGAAELSEKHSKGRISSGIKLVPVSEDDVKIGTVPMKARPVIVGFGPAGMFCALELALHGYAPIVLERGGDISERVCLADSFMKGGDFSPVTNIQFGAGGAGTFSDGKLTTRIGDPLCAKVLKTLCDLGAPEEILWQAKPHIGTDVLRNVVEMADKKISDLGGEIKYKHTVSDVGDRSVTVMNEKVEYGALVLAIGHSARDTYGMLVKNGFDMIPKPFSVGVRIEHLRHDIDIAMYGDAANVLPPAEYALSYREGNRGVYTFCMCPGGVVVPAASEYDGVVTNGMSYKARDGRNSNAAIAVSVLPEDYGNTVEGAVEYQRKLERTAYKYGGGDFVAPAQTVGSFISGKENTIGRINPTYMDGRVRMCNLAEVFPGNITDMLRCGISDFGKSIKGFDCDDAILTGVETRTSAPVRILRGEDRKIIGGSDEIYPCGEGAGYAGGIISAAVDGIRTARAIMEKFAPFSN